jgi:hypothetical protein
LRRRQSWLMKKLTDATPATRYLFIAQSIQVIAFHCAGAVSRIPSTSPCG